MTSPPENAMKFAANAPVCDTRRSARSSSLDRVRDTALVAWIFAMSSAGIASRVPQ